MPDRAAAKLLVECRKTLRRVARRLRQIRGRGPAFRRERDELRSVAAELRAQARDLVRITKAVRRFRACAHPHPN
jgi:hypothetical protein